MTTGRINQVSILSNSRPSPQPKPETTAKSSPCPPGREWLIGCVFWVPHDDSTLPGLTVAVTAPFPKPYSEVLPGATNAPEARRPLKINPRTASRRLTHHASRSPPSSDRSRILRFRGFSHRVVYTCNHRLFVQAPPPRSPPVKPTRAARPESRVAELTRGARAFDRWNHQSKASPRRVILPLIRLLSPMNRS